MLVLFIPVGGGSGPGVLQFPYVVGPDATDFPTFALAYAAALADGRGPADPTVILIKPGTYAESMTLTQPGISVMGLPSARDFATVFTGDLTIALADLGLNRDTRFVSVQGLDFLTGTLRFAGTFAQKLYLTGCSVERTAGDIALHMTNVAADVVGRSQIVARDCRVSNADVAFSAVRQEAGDFDGRDVDIAHSDPGGVALTVIGTIGSGLSTPTFRLSVGEVDGRVECIGAGAAGPTTILFGDVRLASAHATSAATVEAPTSAALLVFGNVGLDYGGAGAAAVTAAGPGAAAFLFADLSFISPFGGPASVLIPPLPFSIPLPRAFKPLVPALWVPPEPPTIEAAVNRIAVALAPLVGGVIP